MLVKELAAMVHENAVKHGFYEGRKLKIEDFLALIHSEWSEALEEARDGRPLVYGMVLDGDDEATPRLTEDWQEITDKHLKPEGCAVELMDGCLRILDLYGYADAQIDNPDGSGPATTEDLLTAYDAIDLMALPGEDAVPEVVTILHAFTSQVVLEDNNLSCLMSAMATAMAWVRQRGIDPIQLLMMKHEYNKGRPFRHGKKF